MRSIVCNQQLVAVCNHFEERYVINPKVLRLDDIPFALQTDYIRLTAITYQSFGLDKNKALAETSALFFGAANQIRTGDLVLTKNKTCLNFSFK